MKNLGQTALSIIKYGLAFIIAFVNIWFELPGGEARMDALEFGLQPPQGVVYTISTGSMNAGEHIMIASLQGITAQTCAKIYITDERHLVYLNAYLEKNPDIVVQDFTDPWEIVKLCLADLNDNGMVLFEEGDNAGANCAATIAGVEKWISVQESDRAKAESIGLIETRNLAQEQKALGDLALQKLVFSQYRDRLNNRFLVHQFPFLTRLRDYAIAAKAPCIFVPESDFMGLVFRSEVFGWMAPNSPVYGWTTGEGAFVEDASQKGLFVIAADHAMNLSFLAAIGVGEAMQQPNHPEKKTADPGKHYVALVMSDGDNLQWYTNAFPHDGQYRQRLASNTDFKMSWTAPPLAVRSAPAALQAAYDLASENDTFVAGVSGAGYINPSQYPKNHLKNFSKLTDLAMQQSGMSVVCLLDSMAWQNNVTLTKWNLQRAYRYFAEQPNIAGGLLQIGSRYAQMNGEIIWSEGKPLISCRKSLWAVNGDDSMTDEWVAEFAAELNALPADNNSQNGYSYVNIHPWSASWEHLNLLVSLLDENVELVTAEELVQLVTDNVKHD